jgi:hypothetical protein
MDHEPIPTAEEYVERQARAARARKLPTLAELRAMSEDDVAQQYDDLAVDGSFIISPDEWLDELNRRSVKRATDVIRRLTWVMAAIAVINLILVDYQVYVAIWG